MTYLDLNGLFIWKRDIVISDIYNKITTMDALSTNIFGSKKFSELFNEIYENQKKKERQIAALITELKPLIKEIGDATLIVPLIKEYLEISVKNDEQLIKMANIIQRAIQNSNSESDMGLSESEKEQLFKDISKFEAK